LELLAHVPLHVVGEHAQKDVRTHSIFKPVVAAVCGLSARTVANLERGSMTRSTIMARTKLRCIEGHDAMIRSRPRCLRVARTAAICP
jgi:hypothetical protein